MEDMSYNSRQLGTPKMPNIQQMNYGQQHNLYKS